MSGQTTGWVLREGPRPTDLDRLGTPYGMARARRMRAVLVTVADAANRDGAHAHPGQQAVMEGSLYGRSTVIATLTDLADEGWLAIEATGGGKGRATVYQVLTTRRTGQSVDAPEVIPANPGSDTGQSTSDTARSQDPDLGVSARQRTTNEVLTTSPDGDALGDETVSAANVGKLMRDYLDWCAREGHPKPGNVGMAGKSVKALLDAGHPLGEMKQAMKRTGTWTIPALEIELAKVHQERERVQGAHHRDAPPVRDPGGSLLAQDWRDAADG